MSGYSTLKQPLKNKGLVFTQQQRQELNLVGLLPSGVLTPEVQLERCMLQLRAKATPLDKYLYLQSMQDTNEDLYYKMLMTYTYELMPLVYTPTVGEACLQFSSIYRQTPRGLYISLNDIGRISQILDNWPEKDIRAIVFTDGERILGLGDLGINGMGIPIGKLALYTACAGVHPKHCLPVTLDVGTNNVDFLQDPFYMGLKQKREVGSSQYDQLVEEFMTECKKMYGEKVLLQFEDFGNSNAFRLLHKYENTHCTFNDDIQGTASVIVGGILASTPLCGISISEQKFVFLGAGEAGTGIADLIALAIHKESGKCIEDCRKQIWLVDSRGLVNFSRKESLQHHKVNYAHALPPSEEGKVFNLLESIHLLKPTALIGVCTIPSTFTKEVCEAMTQYSKNPLIFALSNPTSKAECTAEEAYTFTRGRCIFASGSPFDPVILPAFDDKPSCTKIPGQGNNSYIFPGIGLGVICAEMIKIDNEVMLIAAETLASLVTEDDLNNGTVYPNLKRIREVSLKIAIKVAEYGFEKGYARKLPKPENLEEYIKSQVFNP